MNDNFVDVSISDMGIFQYIVLLVDRPDFLAIRNVIRILLKHYHKRTLLEEYGDIPSEIHFITNRYKYPKELEKAILAAVVQNAVTDKEVEGYNPARRTKQNPVNKYKNHPILGLRSEPAIKLQRCLYKMRKFYNFGYRKLSILYGIPITSVQSSIKSYSQKISIPLNLL